MWSKVIDTVSVTATLFILYQTSEYIKKLKSLIECKLRKAKSDRASYLLDKVLTDTFALDRLKFAEKLPGFRSEIEQAKFALEQVRTQIDADRSIVISASEAALNERSKEYFAESEIRLESEKRKIQESVDERRRDREITSKRIFGKAKQIDKYFRNISEGPQVHLDLENIFKNAFISKISDPQISGFAREVFGVESGEAAEDLVLLKESEISADQLCRLLECLRPEQSRLKALLTELLLEAVQHDSEILFEALRVTRGDGRLLEYINLLPLAEILAQLKPTDDKEIISLVLDRFQAGICDKDELGALADFCELADFADGGRYVDWHAVDSATLAVCRRLTSAEKYAEMVKEVIKRQQPMRPVASSPPPAEGTQPILRQARKSIC